MATSILPGGHSHFDHGPQFYPQTMYHDFSQHNAVMPSSHSQFALPNTQDDSISLNASQTWPSQLSSRRASSKSPNVPERTPIRHNRVNQSRTRSTSGTEALLAYATGQSLQQQQQQQQSQQQQPSLATPPILQQTTPMSSPPMFPSQTFTSMSPSSPFLQQQNYYDNSSSAFTDLQGQHVNQAVSEYYPLARNEIHASPISATSMNPQEAMYMQHASQPRPQALPSMSAQSLSFPPISRPLESTPGNVEISSSRNKPQCWDHGCNGRQFSTFSNLLRHQREKSGTAAKARCPHCGTEFTRTTARNGHMYGGKCKGMPDASKRSSISESIENAEE